jgi:predicted O-methyltransferase YrrM
MQLRPLRMFFFKTTSRIFFVFALLSFSTVFSNEKTESSSLAQQPEIERYLRDRIPSSDKRYVSLAKALNLLQQRKAKVVVETGTARDGKKNFTGDGGSTIILGDWVNQNRAFLYSVDISPKAVAKAKKATKLYSKHVDIVCSDSIQFLTNFKQPIDFLYLDSFDFDSGNPAPSQEHHLKEIIAAYPKLHKNSVVMIDDCALPHGGKGKLVIQFLLSKGWKILYEGYQAILVNDLECSP